MQGIDSLDELALFKLAIYLEIPELLKWCESNKKVNRLVCNKDPIWNYHLNKEFSSEMQAFKSSHVSEEHNLSPKELYKLLYSLRKLKDKLKPFYDSKTLFELYNIEEISLDNKNIKELPKEIGVLRNLKSLIMYNNKIKSIPKEIGNLNTLLILDLRINKIETIPKELANLKSLQYLDLSQNQIKEIPKEIGSLVNLVKLALNDNHIEHIPVEMGNLHNLKFLDLRYNKIKIIPKEVFNLNIKGFYIQRQNI